MIEPHELALSGSYPSVCVDRKTELTLSDVAHADFEVREFTNQDKKFVEKLQESWEVPEHARVVETHQVHFFLDFEGKDMKRLAEWTREYQKTRIVVTWQEKMISNGMIIEPIADGRFVFLVSEGEPMRAKQLSEALNQQK